MAQTCCAPISLSCADLVREMAADHAGVEEFRIAEGYGALLDQYSAGLPIQLNRPVKLIRRTMEEVEVVTAMATLSAGQVLLTVPVSVLQANQIAFDPPLSASKQAAIAAFRTAAATKLLYRFREPLWDESLAYMMHTGLAARWWTPGYPRPGAAVLCCFLTAKRATAIDAMHESDALKLGLDELVGLLGRRDVHEKCVAAKRVAWAHDPYALGGYAHIPPGAAAARPILAQPEGDQLFFAGGQLRTRPTLRLSTARLRAAGGRLGKFSHFNGIPIPALCQYLANPIDIKPRQLFVVGRHFFNTVRLTQVHSIVQSPDSCPLPSASPALGRSVGCSAPVYLPAPAVHLGRLGRLRLDWGELTTPWSPPGIPNAL
ncbi:MAG: FAD-dependent oxidoreductase [Caldilineaceae bacterium]